MVRIHTMEKRIQIDKKKPGVIMELRNSELVFNLVTMIQAGVIKVEDLEVFSDDLREVVAE